MVSEGVKTVATVAAASWVLVLGSIVAGQRSLLFPRSAMGEVAAPVNANTYVELDVSNDASRPAGVGPRIGAAHWPAASARHPTLVFFHANADQLGWGAEYVAPRLCGRGGPLEGAGFLGVEYPG